MRGEEPAAGKIRKVVGTAAVAVTTLRCTWFGVKNKACEDVNGVMPIYRVPWHEGHDNDKANGLLCVWCKTQENTHQGSSLPHVRTVSASKSQAAAVFL